MQDKKRVYGGIDAGGTSFKCILASNSRAIMSQETIPTTNPQDTLGRCIDFFKNFTDPSCRLQALGIASFGPLDIDSRSTTYGTYLPGPKIGWAGTNLYAIFNKALGVPISIDTDVNGALLAEMAWGNAINCQSAAYITVGTGIGAGIMSAGLLMGKPAHPEFGHIRVQRHPYDRDFTGICNVHGDCLEGLASGPSIHARYGNPQQLPQDHRAWDMIAFYLAQACISLSLSFRPQAIILGGGVMQTQHLFPKIREHYISLLGNYLGQDRADIDALILPPGLESKAGLWGGIYLAQMPRR